MAEKQYRDKDKQYMKKRVKKVARGNVNVDLKKMVREHPELMLDLDRAQIRRSV